MLRIAISLNGQFRVGIRVLVLPGARTLVVEWKEEGEAEEAWEDEGGDGSKHGWEAG